MTSHLNEQTLTDVELDGVGGGYSLSEFKQDLVDGAKAFNQGIHDGYREIKKLLS